MTHVTEINMYKMYTTVKSMEDLIFFAAQTLNDAGGDYENFREQIRDEVDQIRAGGMGAALNFLGECWETELYELIKSE